MRNNSPPRVASMATKSALSDSSDLVSQFDLSSAPGHLLRRCHSRARAIFDDLIGRETGLSKQQVALLVAIAHNPAATHTQLAEETGFDRNTLADTLNRLIAKGLALRQLSQADARAYEIQLTPEGLGMLEGLLPRSFEVQARIMEPLPEELRSGFIRCLQILAGIGPEPDEVRPQTAEVKTRGRRALPR